ncbi:hypothetical protein ABZT43_39880 [Streptomyces sp. NPDC005349]|uniref:hypothetical protein n=1 Tax=Streptomyces sp. NPDC005349 TaxID=3157037 RepID=UPI00339DA975
MAFVGDEHVVGAFCMDGADPAFRERGCPWAAWRDLDDLDVLCGDTPSKAAVNLLSRSRMRKRKLLPDRSWRVIMRFRASCVTQAPVGCAVKPRTWT